MAIYKILRKNSVFKGFVGEEVQAVPGPLLDASVRAGIVQRIDVVEAVQEKKSKKSKKDD